MNYSHFAYNKPFVVNLRLTEILRYVLRFKTKTAEQQPVSQLQHEFTY